MGGISSHYKTPLYHVDGNLNVQRDLHEILQPLVVLALQQIGDQAVFMDDNDTKHCCRGVNTFCGTSWHHQDAMDSKESH